MSKDQFSFCVRLLKRNPKIKEVEGILDTEEKVIKARMSLEDATRKSFERFARPICINTKTIVFD